MPTRRHLLAAGLALPALAHAQGAWPDRPIRIFVPSAAGGAADLHARVFGHFLEKKVSQPVVVDNRPGAGGIIGTEATKNAPADGYNFLISTNSTHSANEFLYKKLPYDPVADFAPVGLFTTYASVGMVPAESALRSIADVIALAKAKPGEVFFGYYSSSSQVPSELVKARAGIDITGVAYRNVTGITTDLASGRIHFAFADNATATAPLQTGRVRAIAVTSLDRLPNLPDVPTVAETLPGFEMEGWIGLTAPAGTPAPVVARMNALMREAATDPAARDALEKAGMRVRAMSVEEFTAFLKADRARWEEWVRIARIEPQ